MARRGVKEDVHGAGQVFLSQPEHSGYGEARKCAEPEGGVAQAHGLAAGGRGCADECVPVRAEGLREGGKAAVGKGRLVDAPKGQLVVSDPLAGGRGAVRDAAAEHVDGLGLPPADCLVGISGGKDEEQIKETRFRVVRRGRGYEPQVESQR